MNEQSDDRRMYCTLFDARYLARAVALHQTLVLTQSRFTLWLFCMDLEAELLLDGLQLENSRTVSVRDLERSDPQLSAVRGSRSPAEYCWTATPSACLYCLEHEMCSEITYLDADMAFYGDSRAIFDEFGQSSVLITPARSSPQWVHWEALGGTYVVQFMTFRSSAEGLTALRWWREQCLRWCFNRHEPGKFGDQKYLDDWLDRFEGVHELKHVGGGLAPWNSSRYELTVSAGDVLVDGVPLVFYHHQGLELYRGIWSLIVCGIAETLDRIGVGGGEFHLTCGPVALGWRSYPPYRVSGARARTVERKIWRTYGRLLSCSYHQLRSVRPDFEAGTTRVSAREVGFWILRDLLSVKWRSRLGWLRRPLGGLIRPANPR